MVHSARGKQWELYAKLVFSCQIDSFNGVQGSLLNNAELWKSVPNDTFFSAIWSSWAAYQPPNQPGGTASSQQP
jgi:hypothetical protein